MNKNANEYLWLISLFLLLFRCVRIKLQQFIDTHIEAFLSICCYSGQKYVRNMAERKCLSEYVNIPTPKMCILERHRRWQLKNMSKSHVDWRINGVHRGFKSYRNRTSIMPCDEVHATLFTIAKYTSTACIWLADAKQITTICRKKTYWWYLLVKQSKVLFVLRLHFVLAFAFKFNNNYRYCHCSRCHCAHLSIERRLDNQKNRRDLSAECCTVV